MQTCIQTYMHTVSTRPLSSSRRAPSVYIHTYIHMSSSRRAPSVYIHTYIHTYTQCQQGRRAHQDVRPLCRKCRHFKGQYVDAHLYVLYILCILCVLYILCIVCVLYILCILCVPCTSMRSADGYVNCRYTCMHITLHTADCGRRLRSER